MTDVGAPEGNCDPEPQVDPATNRALDDPSAGASRSRLGAERRSVLPPTLALGCSGRPAWIVDERATEAR
jgi:hypothetical protein